MSTPASRRRRLATGSGLILLVLMLALFRPNQAAKPSLPAAAATPAVALGPAAAGSSPMLRPVSTPSPASTVEAAPVKSVKPVPATASPSPSRVIPHTATPTTADSLASSPTPAVLIAGSLTPTAGHTPTLPPIPTVLTARVVPPEELPPPHLILERPFTAQYRQHAEATYPYGSRGDGHLVLHSGIDISNADHTPVLAVADATVTYSGRDDARVLGPNPLFYGDVIVMRLAQQVAGRPVFVLYGHLSERYVKSGESVRAGQGVGAVGMTGIAMGPHLHIEVRSGDDNYDSTRNPALWLRPLPGQGVLAGRISDGAGRPWHGRPLWIYESASGEERRRPVRTVQSYPDEPEINGDDLWQENFAAGDLPAGEYVLEAGRPGMLAQVPFTITQGEITFVEIKITE